MTLYLLAFAAGALTLLSPCILPVLPFMLAGSGQPLWRSTLPLLLGMAITFALVASLAAVGGGWAVRLGEGGRLLGLAWLAVVGLALLWPSVAARLAAPLAAAGQQLLQTQRPHATGGWWLMTGVATGLLWAPCAGPVLGLVLTGAALNGPGLDTTLQLLAFGAGAAGVMTLVGSAGHQLLGLLRRVGRAVEWPRRVLGALVLASVAAIALGVSEQVLLRVPSTATNYLEERMIDLWMASSSARDAAAGVDSLEEADLTGAPGGLVPTAWWGGQPESGIQGVADGSDNALLRFAGATRWFNGGPVSAQGLKGKVVLVNFWTYSCINCLRALPAVRAWAQQYGPQGLVVIGVHTPEFAFEKDPANVARAVKDLSLSYPIAQDNDYRLWRTFNNQYWPAVYVLDGKGRIRHRQFGEDGADKTEQVIRTLLKEAGATETGPADMAAQATGVGLPADLKDLRSPESYIGYAQATSMASLEPLRRDQPRHYSAGPLGLNEWALTGQWTVGPEFASLNDAAGTVAIRFHARDLHLVMGSPAGAAPIGFLLTIDGHPPGDEHGVDVDAQGHGVVNGARLYQLVRQRQVLKDRRVEIRFEAPGLRAYAFTFG